jgi:hypothetical protein
VEKDSTVLDHMIKVLVDGLEGGNIKSPENKFTMLVNNLDSIIKSCPRN